MLVIAALGVALVVTLGEAAAVRTVVHGDVCQSFSSRKVYLEPGTGALLYATNISSEVLKSRIPRDVNGVLLGSFARSSSIVLRRKPRNIPSIDFTDSILWKDVSDLNFPLVQNYESSRTPESQNTIPNYNKKEKENIPSEDPRNTHNDVDMKREQKILRYMDIATSNFRSIPFLRLTGQTDGKTANTFRDFSHDMENSQNQFLHASNENMTDLKLQFNSSERKPHLSPTDDRIQLPYPTLRRTEPYSAINHEYHHPMMQGDLQNIVNGLPLHIHRPFRGSSKEGGRPSSEASDPDRQTVPELPKPDLQQCGLDIYTCAGCHLHFEFLELHLPSCSTNEVCRCDYIRLREPPYLNAEDGRDICGSFDQSDVAARKAREYTTLTREASLYFLYRNVFIKAFSLSVSALRNSFLISRDSSPSTGILRSPFFPELYPKDYWVEYIFTGINQTSRVQITFEDFGISPWSFIEVHDNQRVHVAAFNGNVFRPPLLVSTGSRLTLKFAANGDTGRGFKLRYIFSDIHELLPPYRSDCGGFVTNFGGTITMLNMTGGLGSSRTVGEVPYDCVWLIKPPQEYGLKSHLSIRVVNFDYMGVNSNIEIRQGLTSDDKLLEDITSSSPRQPAALGKEHVVAFDSGFYVRLRGIFGEKSHLAIVYASFNYEGGCYPLTDLKCHNQRCVPKMLRCDGFDHCGDNSDEPSTCYSSAAADRGDTDEGEDAGWWYKHTPNYYFPYRTPLFGEQQGSGILLLSSLFVLILVIMGLISFMIRQGGGSSNSRPSRGHRRHRRNSLNDGVEIFDASADDPPLYEAPPDYEDVVKFILSGNNLKLVRRPGGMTAWVTNVEGSPSSSAEPSALPGQTTDLLTPVEGDRNVPLHNAPNVTQLAPLPLIPHTPFARAKDERKSRRTRHASLDLEERGDVVIWDPNHRPNKAGSSGCGERRESPCHYRYHPSTPPHLPSALRRTSMQSPDMSAHSDTPREVEEPVSKPNEDHNEVAGSFESSEIVGETDTSIFQATTEERAEEPSSISSSVDPLCPPKDDEVCEEVVKPSQKSVRKSKKFKKGKRKKIKSTSLSVESKDSNPPSYDLVLQQVLDEFYITDEAYVIDDLKNNIGAQLRVRVAREKFQQLCASTNGSMDEIYTKTRKENDGENSRKNTISPGTVKRRKARLLNAKRSDELKKISKEEKSVCWLADKNEPMFTHGPDSDANFLGKMTKCTFRKSRKASFSRNKSTPSLGNVISRDLEIYFSQKTPSPTSDSDELFTKFDDEADTANFTSVQGRASFNRSSTPKLDKISPSCEPSQYSPIFNCGDDSMEDTNSIQEAENCNCDGNNSSGSLTPRTDVCSINGYEIPIEDKPEDSSPVTEHSPTSSYPQLAVHPPLLVSESIPQIEHAFEYESFPIKEPVPEYQFCSAPDFTDSTNEQGAKVEQLNTSKAAAALTGAIPKRRPITRANTVDVVGATLHGVEV